LLWLLLFLSPLLDDNRWRLRKLGLFDLLAELSALLCLDSRRRELLEASELESESRLDMREAMIVFER